ncbi:hypothetical protein ACH4D3_40030 [Streptomyces sp. NPDC018026]|uniref:hypothetical protein n=1 Tax=Streptomyces sp. NPDC018026 TaxID=3365031 RepID=UPI0037ABC1F0
MTPWLRTLRATGLVGALGAGAVVAPCGAGPAHGAGLPAVVAPFAAAPSPGSSAPAEATVPDGSGTHDGRGGHERPRRPDGHDRTERPDAGSASRPSEDSGPAGSAGRGSPEPSRPAPSASRSPSASGTEAGPEPSRAGSRPGEGRQRPGRAEERAPERDGGDEDADRYGDGGDGVPEDDPATAVPTGRTEAAQVPPATPSRSSSRSAAPTRAAAEPVLRVLPLGSGLVLIGLGLALGLVGLRLRRG